LLEVGLELGEGAIELVTDGPVNRRALALEAAHDRVRTLTAGAVIRSPAAEVDQPSARFIRPVKSEPMKTPVRSRLTNSESAIRPGGSPWPV
jgi:hypothetical protein